GVEEGDAAAAYAHPRLGVDQLEAGGAEALQGRVDVGDGVGDMMEPRPLAGEELAHRRHGTERAKELDVSVADVEEDRLDPLRLHRLPVREAHLEGPLVERDRRLQVLDGDADVVNPSEH